jgi:hypothetical protein
LTRRSWFRTEGAAVHLNKLLRKLANLVEVTTGMQALRNAIKLGQNGHADLNFAMFLGIGQIGFAVVLADDFL